MFPKELDGRINRIAAPVHQSREMSWEQQRNGTLGSPDKVYLDQRREIAFSASFASWGLSVIKTNGGPIRTKGFRCYYQGWYQLLSQAFVGANDALSSIPSHRIIIYTLAFMMFSIGTTKEEDHYGARKWDLATMTYLFQENPKTRRRRREMHFRKQICKETTSGSQKQPFSHACRPPVKPFRGILIEDSISISSKKYIQYIHSSVLSANRTHLSLDGVYENLNFRMSNWFVILFLLNPRSDL